LFYASVRSAGRLGAYRNALWGKAVEGSGVRLNLLKDIAYMSVGLARRVFTKEYARALLRGDNFYLMNCKHHFLTLCDFVANFKHIGKYYTRVVELKKKVEIKYKALDSTSQRRVTQSL
jgi:hypothetical protein